MGSLKRISKELLDACDDSISSCGFTLAQREEGEAPLFVETTEDGNKGYTVLLVMDTSADLGTVGIRIAHPPEYPFKPFRMMLDPAHCSNLDRLRYKLQHVCPDLTNWTSEQYPYSLDGFMHGTEYLSTCLIPELATDKWSPAQTVIGILTRLALGKRLSGPSFVEAYPTILKAIPDLKEGEEGVAKIVFGGYMEGIPSASNCSGCRHEFVLLMDPLYALEGADCLETIKGERQTTVRLSAAWCFKDPSSWQTMEQLLQALTAKSFTKITVRQSGIQLKMPGNLPTERGSGFGFVTTAGSYGG